MLNDTLHNLANNPDIVDKLEGLVALWSKVIEQVLAESEQVGTYDKSLTIFNNLIVYGIMVSGGGGGREGKWGEISVYFWVVVFTVRSLITGFQRVSACC